MNTNESKENCIFFDVPILPAASFAPCNVYSVFLIEKPDDKSVLRFIVKRDLSVSISSFTISYRFSSKPINEEDSENEFFSYEYKNDNINEKEFISFKGRVPEDYKLEGCTAFISSVTLSEGGIITFSPADYSEESHEEIDNLEELENNVNVTDALNVTVGDIKEDENTENDPNEVSEITEDTLDGTEEKIESVESVENDASPTSEENEQSKESDNDGDSDEASDESDEEKSDTTSTDAAAESSDESEGNTPAEKSGNDEPQTNVTESAEDSSANTEESEGEKENKRKAKKKKIKIIAISSVAVLLIASSVAVVSVIYGRKGMEKTIDSLLSENRYNEAYMICQRSSRDDLMEKICSSARDYYIEADDYANAYAFALAINEEEADIICEKAFDKLAESDKKALNTELFSVAQKLTDDSIYDEKMISLAEKFEGENEYTASMRCVLTLRDSEKKAELENAYFKKAIAYYTDDGMYQNAVSFIISYGAEGVDESSVNIDILKNAIDYCKSNQDTAGAIILSEKFGMDYSDIEITPWDRSITNQLETVYSLLTEKQKREYHANKFTYYKEAFLIEDGKIEGTDITDAVSVDTYERHTVILHEDGKVTSLENGGHNMKESFPDKEGAVQIAAGLSHTSILYANGTVTSVGDNSYGQCDTGDWTGIVSIAAGRYFTIGLKKDGTVVSTGSNKCAQCNVSDYKNVVWIGACDQSTVLMFADGTVHVQGDSFMGLYNANAFKNVVRINAHGTAIIAEKSDGKFVMADGTVEGSSGKVDNWSNIKYFCPGEASIAYVNENGTIKTSGDSAA